MIQTKMNSIDVERRRKEDDNDHINLDPYTNHLEERIKDLQNQILILKTQNSQKLVELKSVRRELEVCREDPLITGEIEDILDEYDKRVIVRASSGGSR